MVRGKKPIVAALGAAAIVIGAASAAYATDTGDHFSLASGTIVSAKLATGTKLTFKGSIDGVNISVACTGFAASGKIPASGLTVTLPASPKISGCKDSLGGTDTVTTNMTNGSWTLTEVDALNDEAKAEPNATGDKATLTIPQAGATFQSSALSSCVVTAAPTGPAPVTGTFNDKNLIKVVSAPIPTSGSGCTSTTALATGTILLSKSVHDVS
jgi:hypothetical protein